MVHATALGDPQTADAGCYAVSGGIMKQASDGFSSHVEESHDPAESAHRVMEFAKAVLNVAAQVKMPNTQQPVGIRIGMHTGDVVSGMIGSRLPKFSVLGDAMNTASRMESSGELACPGIIMHLSSIDWPAESSIIYHSCVKVVPGRIHASEATCNLLPLVLGTESIDHATQLSIGGVPGRIQASEATHNLLPLVIGTESIDHATQLSIEGVPGRIHASEATRNLLPREDWEATGGMEVEGKVGTCSCFRALAFLFGPLQLAIFNPAADVMLQNPELPIGSLAGTGRVAMAFRGSPNIPLAPLLPCPNPLLLSKGFCRQLFRLAKEMCLGMCSIVCFPKLSSLLFLNNKTVRGLMHPQQFCLNGQMESYLWIPPLPRSSGGQRFDASSSIPRSPEPRTAQRLLLGPSPPPPPFAALSSAIHVLYSREISQVVSPAACSRNWEEIKRHRRFILAKEGKEEVSARAMSRQAWLLQGNAMIRGYCKLVELANQMPDQQCLDATMSSGKLHPRSLAPLRSIASTAKDTIQLLTSMPAPEATNLENSLAASWH
eukprot:473814-Pelagomonas_calceolata.AAC.5